MRVGIDQTFGQYNAPINPVNNDFIYLPIPQSIEDFENGKSTNYQQITGHFDNWCKNNNASLDFPKHLLGKGTHLDPDFDNLTYGDQATGRGLRVKELQKGDFIVFFGSFKPISPSPHNLIYAIFGIMFVDKVMKVADISPDEFHLNAHTRIIQKNQEHLVVFATPNSSGRLKKALTIGERREGTYRVSNEILDAWGGLGVKNGFIQRSVCPPWFSNPSKFLTWFEHQKTEITIGNW